nr:MAG TPA: tail assembly chaperone protein [Caudoviricetes sp.]
MKEPVKFKLCQPIEHGDKTIDELTIRFPTTKEIRKVGGFPYKTDSQYEEAEIDTEKAARYLSICADIPPSVVDKMDIGDFQNACFIINGFFMASLSRRFSIVASK